MLIEFSVENFRSIKEKVTLSMVASGHKELEENVISLEKPKEMRLLKSAAIYGPNASGKSNVLNSLYLLSRVVLKSHKMQKGTPLPFISFKLDKEYVDKPSSFEVNMLIDDVLYKYRLSADEKKVHYESLFFYPHGRPARIFERNDEWGFTFTRDKKIQNDIAEKTRENALYLSTATAWNYEPVSKVFDWFKQFRKISASTEGIYEYTIELTTKNNKAREFVRDFLKKADVGIDDFSAKIEEIKLEDLLKSTNKILIAPSEEHELDDIRVKSPDVKAIHKVEDEEIIFDFDDEESDGTQRFFDMAGPWFDLIYDKKILFIDEISLRLHPHLVEFLIKKFHEESSRGSQLIFTTHNTYILRLDLFRKDQIWFTEKKEDRSTDLYSLYDIKNLRDTNIEKGYLLGRYGAVPYLDWR